MHVKKYYTQKHRIVSLYFGQLTIAFALINVMITCRFSIRYLQSNDNNVPQDMVYEYDDFYFCPDPESLIYSHFPEDPKWQLLRQPLRYVR